MCKLVISLLPVRTPVEIVFKSCVNPPLQSVICNKQPGWPCNACERQDAIPLEFFERHQAASKRVAVQEHRPSASQSRSICLSDSGICRAFAKWPNFASACHCGIRPLLMTSIEMSAHPTTSSKVSKPNGAISPFR